MKKHIVSILRALHLLVPLQMLIDGVGILIGAVVFLFTQTTPKFAHQNMVRLFSNTGGRSNDWISRIIGIFRPARVPSTVSGILGNLTQESICRAVKDIDEKGYHIFEQRLSDDLCDALLRFALETEASMRGPNQKVHPTEIYNRSNPKVVRYEFLPENLIKDQAVQKVMSDPSVGAVAAAYLRARPIADVLSMWWHTSFSKVADAFSAQYYHFDMDRPKWLKFFFYLTDVGPENGPHCFIKGSHRAGGIPRDILKQGYTRLDDEQVFSKIPKSREIEFVGPKGTIFAEDTRGLHKGMHVMSGDRLVFQIQFSNSLFGANYYSIHPEPAATPEIGAQMNVTRADLKYFLVNNG